MRPSLSERSVTALGTHSALFKAEQQPRCEGVNPAHGQPLQPPLLLRSWGPEEKQMSVQRQLRGVQWGPGLSSLQLSCGTRQSRLQIEIRCGQLLSLNGGLGAAAWVGFALVWGGGGRGGGGGFLSAAGA